MLSVSIKIEVRKNKRNINEIVGDVNKWVKEVRMWWENKEIHQTKTKEEIGSNSWGLYKRVILDKNIMIMLACYFISYILV